MKMRLIDLDEAIDAIERTDWYHINDCGELSEGAEDENHALYLVTDIYKAIGEVQQVDAKPVRHGRFIGTEYDGYADGNPVYYEWKCSECGCVFEDEEPTYNYCPNCGAKLDGGEHGTDK